MSPATASRKASATKARTTAAANNDVQAMKADILELKAANQALKQRVDQNEAEIENLKDFFGDVKSLFDKYTQEAPWESPSGAAASQKLGKSFLYLYFPKIQVFQGQFDRICSPNLHYVPDTNPSSKPITPANTKDLGKKRKYQRRKPLPSRTPKNPDKTPWDPPIPASESDDPPPETAATKDRKTGKRKKSETAAPVAESKGKSVSLDATPDSVAKAPRIRGPGGALVKKQALVAVDSTQGPRRGGERAQGKNSRGSGGVDALWAENVRRQAAEAGWDVPVDEEEAPRASKRARFSSLKLRNS
ncbi:MAG: hypothetical protein Q9162_001244 [Coniocarpon cinnabarinum]